MPHCAKQNADLLLALQRVAGCFDAAEAEGLNQALEETTDDRLCDLVRRRLSFAALYAAEALEHHTRPAANAVCQSDAHTQNMIAFTELFDENLRKDGFSDPVRRNILSILMDTQVPNTPAAADAGGQTCDGCDGRGIVGGFISADSGYQDDICPHCNGAGTIATGIAEASQHAMPRMRWSRHQTYCQGRR